MLLPVNGIMAKCIEESNKGKASGWYQAGSLAGVGLGGGAGLWLATHYTVVIAGIVLCTASAVFALVILLMMPIGTGAAANIWSAIGKDWNTNADTVALITGVVSGLVSAVGCIAGVFIIDRWGNWVAYLGSGILCALVTFIMAILPMQPAVYIGGVLTYTFGIGLINAAFTSVILFAIGKKHVATKYSLIASLGNLPVVYMTAFDGWAHDKFNSKYMLMAEAIAGVLCVIIFTFILKRMMNKKLIPAVIA